MRAVHVVMIGVLGQHRPQPQQPKIGATRVEDGVAWRRRRLMVLGIGLRLLDLNQVSVATTPARLFRLPVGLAPWLAW
jgi:hypothetical protein